MKNLPRVLFVKAHVASHVRKNGAVVRAYDTRVQSQAKPPQKAREAAPEKDWRDEENWHTRTQMRMRTLPEASLHYIIKDATEAAEIGEKSGFSAAKTGRYRDEAHYASMELYQRRKAVQGVK